MAWRRKAARVAGRRAELLIDLRFRDEAPVPNLPVLHWVGVWCRSPVNRERFIPAGEQQIFLKLERKTIEIARRLSQGWAVYVMRLVSEGHVDCLFYARDAATLDGLAAEVKQSFPEYRIEQDCRPDAGWAEYFKYLK